MSEKRPKRPRAKKVAVILPNRPTAEDWARMSAEAAEGRGQDHRGETEGQQQGGRVKLRITVEADVGEYIVPTLAEWMDKQRG